MASLADYSMWNESDREPGVPVRDVQKERIPGQRHDLNRCTLQALSVTLQTPARFCSKTHRAARIPDGSQAVFAGHGGIYTVDAADQFLVLSPRYSDTPVVRVRH